MKTLFFSLFISLAIFFSETKGYSINDIKDKSGNSDKSYSVKMKSVTKKDTKNIKSNEKKSKKEKKKGGYR